MEKNNGIKRRLLILLFFLIYGPLVVCTIFVGAILWGYIIEVKESNYGNPVTIRDGICDNGNVYLSYNRDPCGIKTPMIASYCTKDSDCEGGVWASNAGCCDISTNQCKSWLMELSDNKISYKCKENNKHCMKNSDCASGEFCNLVSTTNDCYIPDAGSCMALGPYDAYTYIKNGENKTFIVSFYPLMWWGAENWCRAQGKNLITYNTLQSLFECDKDKRVCNWDNFTEEQNWKDGMVLSHNFWIQESYNSCNAWAQISWPQYAKKGSFTMVARMNTWRALCE